MCNLVARWEHFGRHEFFCVAWITLFKTLSAVFRDEVLKMDRNGLRQDERLIFFNEFDGFFP